MGSITEDGGTFVMCGVFYSVKKASKDIFKILCVYYTAENRIGLSPILFLLKCCPYRSNTLL